MLLELIQRIVNGVKALGTYNYLALTLILKLMIDLISRLHTAHNYQVSALHELKSANGMYAGEK